MRRIEQSVDRQIETIEKYRRKGVLGKLAFAVEMDLPKPMRGSDGKRYAAADFPPGRIPCIPVVDAWFVSMALAEELDSLFIRDNQGKGIDFYPALCASSTPGLYIYGMTEDMEQIDMICMECGAVAGMECGAVAGMEMADIPDHDYFCCRDCLDRMVKIYS